MVMSKSQKDKEDELFGPFKSFAINLAEGPPDVDALFEEAVSKTEGKFNAKLFQQFLHKVAMCLLGLAAGDKDQAEAMMEMGMGRHTPGAVREEITPEKAFAVGCALVDIVVPELASDIFRIFDHNGDGEISKDEWTKTVHLFDGPPSPEIVNDLVFTILDKNQNGKMEKEELVEFATKIVNLVANLAKVAIEAFSKVAVAGGSHEVSDQLFAMFSQDGKISAEALFNNYDESILRGIGMMPSEFAKNMAQAGNSRDANVNAMVTCGKTLITMLRDLSVLEGPVDQEGFFVHFKSLLLKRLGAIREILKTTDLYAAVMKKASLVGGLDAVVTKAKAGELDTPLHELTNALFVFLDADADGKVGADDVLTYTQFPFELCSTPAAAKARLEQLFKALDRNNNGSLSKEELIQVSAQALRVGKTAVLFQVALLQLTLNTTLGKIVDSVLSWYMEWRAKSDFALVETINKQEFSLMLSSVPRWAPGYVCY